MQENDFTDELSDTPLVPERVTDVHPTRADRFVAESQNYAERQWRRFLFRSFIPLACVLACGCIVFIVGVVGLGNLPPGVAERETWGVVMVAGWALAILGGALTAADLRRFLRGGPRRMHTSSVRAKASTTTDKQRSSHIRKGSSESTQR